MTLKGKAGLCRRPRNCPKTRAYVERRTGEGKTIGTSWSGSMPGSGDLESSRFGRGSNRSRRNGSGRRPFFPRYSAGVGLNPGRTM